MPQVWAERDPGLHPLAACTACKLQQQWEFRETALHQPSTAFGELIPSLAPCSGCQPGKRQGKGIHPPRAGKGGLKEKGKVKETEPFFRAGGMASDRLPYTLHPGLSHGPLFFTDPGLGTSGPKVLKKRVGVNSHTGVCYRGRKHLRPILFPE